jgi:hydrogenase maturation protease
MDLVIGIGNDWRGDDGIGPHVVEAIPLREGVSTMTVHQLVPELAEKIREARRVLFVDAGVDGDAIELTRVEAATHHGLGHACSPSALLGWTQSAYGDLPDSWLLRIPAASFEPGTGLTPQATAKAPEALRRIGAWLDEHPESLTGMSEEEA